MIWGVGITRTNGIVFVQLESPHAACPSVRLSSMPSHHLIGIIHIAKLVEPDDYPPATIRHKRSFAFCRPGRDELIILNEQKIGRAVILWQMPRIVTELPHT